MSLSRPTKTEKQEAAEALESLRNMLPEGSKVYTLVTSVSRSGMSRTMRLMTIDKDGDRRNITHMVACALHYGTKNVGGWDCLKVEGCGMDMGFSVVYNLASAIFGHENRGGYKLKQEWI